jgi:hypothetical protein
MVADFQEFAGTLTEFAGIDPAGIEISVGSRLIFES